jgi:hypothetical protein
MVVDKIIEQGETGSNRLNWDTGSLPPGSYLLRVRAGVQIGIGRIVILN